MNKPKNKRNAVKLALIVLAVVLLAACGTVWYMYSQVAPALDEGEAGQLNQVQDPDLASEGDRTYNLLLLGIDYDTDRDYAEGKGMTDVILYVQIDRDAGTVNAFSGCLQRLGVGRVECAQFRQNLMEQVKCGSTFAAIYHKCYIMYQPWPSSE